MIRNRNAYSDQVLDEVIRIYVTVDETGNLGKSEPFQREYVVAACIVNDRDSFMDVSYNESMAKGREVKFNTDPDLREKVIQAALPYVEDIYYVRYSKDRSIHNSPDGISTEERHDTHMKMINALADAILYDYGGFIVVDVDANSLVRNHEVREAFEKKRPGIYSDVKCEVQDSKYNFGLQTNDFFVGAIGQMVNGPRSTSEEYEESMKLVGMFPKKPHRVFLRNLKRRYLFGKK